MHYLLDLIGKNEKMFQRVVSNGQTSEWLPVKACTLGPVFILIHINKLTIERVSIVELFADNTSLFSNIQDAKKPAYELNKDLQKIAK